MKAYFTISLLFVLINIINGQVSEQEINRRIAKCYSQEDNDCVIKNYEQLVMLKKRSVGATDWEYQRLLTGLVDLLMKEEKFSRAYVYVEEILDNHESNEEQSQFDELILPFIFRFQDAPEQKELLVKRLQDKKPQLFKPAQELNDIDVLREKQRICAFLYDQDCIWACMKQVTRILAVEKGEDDPEYLRNLLALGKYEASMGEFKQAIPKIEKCLAAKADGILGITYNERSDLERTLDRAYQIVEKEEKADRIAEGKQILEDILDERSTLNEQKLNSLSIEQILTVIDGLKESPLSSLGNQRNAAYLTKITTLEERFIQLVDTKQDGQHPRYEEVLKDLFTYYSATVNNNDDTERNAQEMEKYLKKLLAIVEKRTGRKSRDYIEILNRKAMYHLFRDEAEKRLETLTEMLSLVEKFVSEENELYQSTLQQFFYAYALAPDHSPVSDDQLRSYLTKLKRDSEDDSPMSIEQIIRFSKSAEDKTLAGSEFEITAYPNLLDTFLMYPQLANYEKVVAFIQAKIEKLSPSLLSTGNDQANETLLLNINRDLEAFFSFTMELADQYPSLIELALDYINRLEILQHAYKERLGARQSLKEDPKHHKLLQQWADKKRQLNNYYLQQIENPEEENSDYIWVERAVKDLENQLSKIIDERYVPPPRVDWRDIKKQLSSEEAVVWLVRFVKRENGSWTNNVGYAAFVIKSGFGQVELITLPDGKLLETGHFKNYMNSRVYEDDGSLYEAYWQPIQEKLAGIDRVYVVPTGIYHKINLNTLKIPDSRDTYLIDQLDIRCISRGINMLDRQESSKVIRNAVLIGDPKYDLNDNEAAASDEEDGSFFRSPVDIKAGYEREWSRLAESGLEVTKIANLLNSKGIKTKSYLRSEAREAVLKNLNRPDILHVATHGYYSQLEERFEFLKLMSLPLTVNGGYPLLGGIVLNKDITHTSPDSSEWDEAKSQKIRSLTKRVFSDPRFLNPGLNAGLVMAGANNRMNNEDGLLTAYEVLGLDLTSTKLVVLSACKSGVGDIVNGKGISGLQSAFKVAGANYIINSLWDVKDELTQQFMVEFYTRWLEKGQSIEAAFRSAQQQLRESARGVNTPSQVYLWGAFVLINL